MRMYMRMHIHLHRKNNVDSQNIVLTQRIELTQRVWCWLFEYSADLEAMRKFFFDLCFCILYAPLHMFIYEVIDLRIYYHTWTAKPSSFSLFHICGRWLVFDIEITQNIYFLFFSFFDNFWAKELFFIL